MTGLLVSVRSAAEAVVALRAGVDLLDVKEPARGSLGRADRQVMSDVTACATGRAPVSVALGELRDECDYGDLPPGIMFAKLGLAGCSEWTDWPRRWRAALEQLPAGVVPVAVAYADWRTCGAPRPRDVLDVGSRLRCGAALLDTHRKELGGLFDHCGEGEVAKWISAARSLGMRTVLAGSLTPKSAARAASLEPDYIAVRGAACRDGRAGELEGGRIIDLRRHLAERRGHSCGRRVLSPNLR
jgi:uncharacterized protein (UPF0264 family)